MSTGIRDDIANRLEVSDRSSVKKLARFLRGASDTGVLPCWGAIGEQLGELLKSDKDWLAVLHALLEVGSRRALLLFLDAARQRAGVMAKILDDAGRLPVDLQRALVCFDEVKADLPGRLGRLAPSARQLHAAGAEAMAMERQLFRVRVAALTASRFYVPLKRDPNEEPMRKPSDAIERNG